LSKTKTEALGVEVTPAVVVLKVEGERPKQGRPQGRLGPEELVDQAQGTEARVI